MIIDIVALILLALALFKGFTKGLVVAVFSFLAFVIGLAAALKLSALVADHLSRSADISGRWLPFLSFALVFFVVLLLVRLGAKAIERALQAVMLGWANKIGGIIFYALLYLFIFSIVLFFADQMQLIKPQTAEDSVSYSFIRPLGPKVIEGLGVVLPFFRDMFAELEHFFDGLSKKAP